MCRLIESEATKGMDDAYFTALAFDLELGRDRGIDATLKQFELDALVLPASESTTTTPPAIAGYPIVTSEFLCANPSSILSLIRIIIVPLGFFAENTTIESAGPLTVYPAPGVPFGFSFWGTAFSEFDLIGMAFALEQKTMSTGRLGRLAFEAAIPKTQLSDVVGK